MTQKEIEKPIIDQLKELKKVIDVVFEKNPHDIDVKTALAKLLLLKDSEWNYLLTKYD